MVGKKAPRPSFFLTSPEGVGYWAFEDDPFWPLHAEMEPFAPSERLLPLAVLLDPALVVNNHHDERKQLVAQLTQWGNKLSLEEILKLQDRLRQLVLVDHWLQKWTITRAQTHALDKAGNDDESRTGSEHPGASQAPGGSCLPA